MRTKKSGPKPKKQKPKNNKKNSKKNAKPHAKVPKKFNGISRKQEQGMTLKERMMQKLKSSRFRYMNEELYTMKGKDALRYFKEDSSAFDEYHAGYQQQVQKWPINPLDVIIKAIGKEYNQDSVIADFGCGTAGLAAAYPHFKIHSFDLVALSPRVTVCDVSKTPLASATADCVVCCLSLMGTNLVDYIQEANRVLKVGGILKIAEVESRFENVDEFLKNLTVYGFKVLKKDLEKELFYFMDLKKERNISKKGKKKLPEITLKACQYKKR